MKKLLCILSFILFSLLGIAQSYDYYPGTDNNWKVIRPEGFVVIKPANYNPANTYPWMVFVHGMGELGSNRKEDIEGMLIGFSYDGGKTRQLPTIPADFQAAINDYGIIGIVPRYSQFFSPANWNSMLDTVRKYYKIVPKGLGAGFSWGGGSLVKFFRSSVTNAGMLAAAVPIAATIEGGAGAWSNVAAGGTAVWAMVNKGDDNKPYTDTSVTKSIVANINVSNPSVKAIYTGFDVNGHGGTYQALSKTPPASPKGIGVVNAIENIYQWYIDIVKNGPRQPKTGTATTPTAPVVVTNPVISLKQIGVTTVAAIVLDGTASTGFDSWTWSVSTVPAGVNPYTSIIASGGYQYSKATLPAEGAYTIVAKACKGTTCVTDTLKITYQKTSVPVPHNPVSYDSSTGLLSFTDGAKEAVTVTIDWSTKKVVAKTLAGVEYAL